MVCSLVAFLVSCGGNCEEKCTLGFKLCEGILKETEVLTYTKFSNSETSCKDMFEKNMHDAVSERKYRIISLTNFNAQFFIQ
jgi:hypothetical protein